MQLIASGYRGLELIWTMNWDKVMYLATIALALLTSAGLGTLLLP